MKKLYPLSGLVNIIQTLELLRKGNDLFNDALNTFYLWLYGVGLELLVHVNVAENVSSTGLSWKS